MEMMCICRFVLGNVLKMGEILIKSLFGESQILTTSHLVVWVIIYHPQHRVTSIATAFGPPTFKWKLPPCVSSTGSVSSTSSTGSVSSTGSNGSVSSTGSTGSVSSTVELVVSVVLVV